MNAAVVVGGGPCGLATALALAGTGRRVHVVDSSAPPPEGRPAKAAQHWERPTVPHTAHSHSLTSLGVRALRERAPHLLAAGVEEGALLLDLTDAAPRTAGDFVQEPADAELRALAIRRSVLDLVLHRAVRELPGVTFSHRTTVRGLLLDASRRRVRGVVTDSGEPIAAPIVVDATGRRAASRSWLAAAGIPVAPDLTGATNVRGFTRFYRLPDPGGLPGPLNRGNAAGGIWERYAAVAHPADNGTFALTLAVPADDRALAGLRTPESFTAAARLSPFLGPWAAATADPIGPVRSMVVARNTLRGTVTARQRPVTGLFAVGDAACLTDPLFGRGVSLALAHAFRLADLLTAHPAVDEAQSGRAVDLADELLRPWYEQSVYDDAVLDRLWRADDRETARPPVPPVPGRPPLAAVSAAARTDAVVWRGLTRVLMSLDTPAAVFDDEAFRARVRGASAALAAPARVPSPTRAELLDAIATAKGS